MTLHAAATTADGPILVELTATHGIHRGDVVVGLVAHGVAAIVWALVALATARR